MSHKHKDRSWVDPEAIAPLSVPITDNHTHLPVPGLLADGPGSQAPRSAAQLVRLGAQVGVTRQITSACETPAWQGSLELARTLPGVRVALAIHPNEAVAHAGIHEIGPDGLEPVFAPHHAQDLSAALASLTAHIEQARDVVVAVGETGLDYFRTGEQGRKIQQQAFRAHIALAKELDLPLQIHDRQAHADCLAILLADGAPPRTVFHCFSGSSELAQACREHGWYASIAGPVTYRANAELRRALALIPDELLLIETDAPYLPPQPWRGRPNATYLMPETLRFVAQWRGFSEARLCEILQKNTQTVYGVW